MELDDTDTSHEPDELISLPIAETNRLTQERSIWDDIPITWTNPLTQERSVWTKCYNQDTMRVVRRLTLFHQNCG